MLDRFWILYDRAPLRVICAVLALLAFLLIGVLCGIARAADATLNWTQPTSRTDGTALPLTEIRETQIDYAPCTAVNTFPATPTGTRVVTGSSSGAIITGLTYGTWCFRARTVDTTGAASVNTGTVYRVYLAPPNPPTLLSIATIAYELREYTGGTMRMVQIGTVPLGAVCGPKLVGQYATFDGATITKPTTGGIIAARCAGG